MLPTIAWRDTPIGATVGLREGRYVVGVGGGAHATWPPSEEAEAKAALEAWAKNGSRPA